MKLLLLRSLTLIAIVGTWVIPAPAHGRYNTLKSTYASDSASIAAKSISAPNAVTAFEVQATTAATSTAYLPIVLSGIGVKNGGFELGPTGWVTQSANTSDPLIYRNEDLLQGTSPHSGDWAAWLGGRNNENAALRQTVTVPAATPYLEFWQLIASNEANCNADRASVLINGVALAGGTFALCASTATNPNWERKSLDLRSYVGQNVPLDFNMKSDAAIESSWLLDDIAFSATP